MLGRGLAITLLVCTAHTSALAQSKSEPPALTSERALVENGLAAFDRGDYSGALALLQRAARSVPCLTVRLYLARTRAGLGQLLEAAQDYRSVVAGESAEQGAAARRAVESAIEELARLRPRIPSLHVELGEAEQHSRNLRVVLDGALISTDTRIMLDPGRHEVVASDADGEQTRVAFEVLEGEEKTLVLSWSSPAQRADKQADPILGGTSSHRAWGIVALGVGATGLGIGTVTGIAALSRYSAAEAHCPANRCAEGAPHPEDASAFRALRTISAAGYTVGAIGIGTWLTLLLTTPSAGDHPRVSRWTPVVGVGSAGARYAF